MCPPPLSAERRIGWLGECERWFLIRGRTGLRESRSCSTSEHHILCFLKILKYTKVKCVMIRFVFESTRRLVQLATQKKILMTRFECEVEKCRVYYLWRSVYCVGESGIVYNC
jgi:hypothetical protein